MPVLGLIAWAGKVGVFPSACCAKSATAAGCKNVLKNQVVANRLAKKNVE